MKSQESSVVVSLLIFSMRPDPEWTLDEQARVELSSRLREALGGEESNPPPVRVDYGASSSEPSRRLHPCRISRYVAA
jgi:hypothetical protein